MCSRRGDLPLDRPLGVRSLVRWATFASLPRDKLFPSVGANDVLQREG